MSKTQLKVQKVPARSVMLARQMIEAMASDSGQEVVVRNTAPAFFAAGLDFFRLMLIEIGHLEPDVGEEGHPIIRQHFDVLRATWADSDAERDLANARADAAMWEREYRKLYLHYTGCLQAQEASLVEARRSMVDALPTVRVQDDGGSQ